MIRYDSVYLTCSKKLTGSQLSPPHGTNKKLKCETKNHEHDRSGPVPLSWRQSSRYKKSKVGRICWKGRFWAWSERVKEWWMMRVVMIIEMSWQVNEEVESRHDWRGWRKESGSWFHYWHLQMPSENSSISSISSILLSNAAHQNRRLWFSLTANTVCLTNVYIVN